MGAEKGGAVSGGIRYFVGVSGDMSWMMWMNESSSGITCDDSGRISSISLMKVVGRTVGGITVGDFFVVIGDFSKKDRRQMSGMDACSKMIWAIGSPSTTLSRF